MTWLSWIGLGLLILAGFIVFVEITNSNGVVSKILSYVAVSALSIAAFEIFFGR